MILMRGDEFGLKLALGEPEITENFVVSTNVTLSKYLLLIFVLTKSML